MTSVGLVKLTLWDPCTLYYLHVTEKYHGIVVYDNEAGCRGTKADIADLPIEHHGGFVSHIRSGGIRFGEEAVHMQRTTLCKEQKLAVIAEADLIDFRSSLVVRRGRALDCCQSRLDSHKVARSRPTMHQFFKPGCTWLHKRAIFESPHNRYWLPVFGLKNANDPIVTADCQMPTIRRPRDALDAQHGRWSLIGPNFGPNRRVH